MGKIRKCYIDFKDGKELHRPGETVSGVITLEIEGELKVRNIHVFCNGMTLTRWSRLFQNAYESDSMSTEIHVKYVLNVLSAEPPAILSDGSHYYDFRFKLPSTDLPSSFEGSYGAVRYWLKVEVDKPFPSINNTFYRCFTVLAHIDVNETKYRRTVHVAAQKPLYKALGIGNAGTVSMNANIDRAGYCPGEQIFISLEVKNESTKDLGHVKAYLIQKVMYTAAEEMKHTNVTIRVLEGGTLEKGKSIDWNNQALLIDTVPPSTKADTFHIIMVSYSVKIEVHVPLGLDLEAIIPITIGTSPLGTRIPAEPRHIGANLYLTDNSRAINYERCGFGVQNFEKSCTGFLNISFKPLTVYVKNFNPVQALAKLQAASAGTASSNAKASTANKPLTSVAASKAAATAASTKSVTAAVPSKAVTSAASTKAVTAAVPSKSAEAVSTLIRSSAARTTPTLQPHANPTTSSSSAARTPQQTNNISVQSKMSTGTNNTPLPHALNPKEAFNPGLRSPLSVARPTYDEVMSGKIKTTPSLTELPLAQSKNSFLILNFPCGDISLISNYFKENALNLRLHGGRIECFLPEVHLLPSQQTSALLICFESQKTALSWVHTKTSSNIDLSSRWWSLISEEKMQLKSATDVHLLKSLSINLMKKNSEFKITKSFSDEYAKLVKEVLTPCTAKHGVVSVLWGKIVYAGGDWSSFPAVPTELYLGVTKYPSLDHHKAFKQEDDTDPGMKRFRELTYMCYSRVFFDAFNVGDIAQFQDAYMHCSLLTKLIVYNNLFELHYVKKYPL